MKKLLVIFVISIVSLVFSQDIKDVNPTLPVYEAVKFVVENGIMEVDEKGYFKGAQSITKFDLARYIYNFVKVYKLSRVVSIESLAERLDGLEKDFKTLSGVVDGISVGLKELSRFRKDVEEFLETVDASLSHLEKSPESVKVPSVSCEECESLKDSLKSLSRRIDELESSIGGAKSGGEEIISGVEKDVEGLRKLVLSMEKSMRSLETTLDASLESLYEFGSDVVASLTGLSSRVDSVASDLKVLENEISALKSKIGDMGASIVRNSSDLEELNDRFESEMKNVLSKISRVESSLRSELGKRIDEVLKELKPSLIRSIEDLESSQTRLASEVSNLESRLSNLERRVESLGTDLEKTDENVRKIFETFAKKDDLESALKDVRSDLKTLSDALSNLERRLENLFALEDSKYENLRNGLNDLKHDLEMERARTGLEVDALKTGLKELENRVKQLEKALVSSLKSRKSCGECEMPESVLQDLSNLKERMDSVEDEVGRLDYRMRSLKRLDELEENQKTLEKRLDEMFLWLTVGMALGLMGVVLGTMGLFM